MKYLGTIRLMLLILVVSSCNNMNLDGNYSVLTENSNEYYEVLIVEDTLFRSNGNGLYYSPVMLYRKSDSVVIDQIGADDHHFLYKISSNSKGFILNSNFEKIEFFKIEDGYTYEDYLKKRDTAKYIKDYYSRKYLLIK